MFGETPSERRKASVWNADEAAGVEDREREPLQRFSYEYRDADGNVLGHAELEIDEEEQDLSILKDGKQVTVQGHLIRTFVIRGEKDGQAAEVDLIGLTELDIPTFVVAGLTADFAQVKNCTNSDETSEAVLPFPETLIDFGWMLHEIGHTAQFKEKSLEPIAKLYRHEGSIMADSEGYEGFKRRLEAVVTAMPEAVPVLEENRDVLNQLDELEKRRQKFAGEAQALSREIHSNPFLSDASAAVERLRLLGEQQTAVVHAQGLLIKHMDILAIAALPTKVMELDASKRAVDWMHAIKKQTGVNVFADVEVSPERILTEAAPEDCRTMAETARHSGDTAVLRTNILQQLRAGLRSYNAETWADDALGTDNA